MQKVCRVGATREGGHADPRSAFQTTCFRSLSLASFLSLFCAAAAAAAIARTFGEIRSYAAASVRTIALSGVALPVWRLEKEMINLVSVQISTIVSVSCLHASGYWIFRWGDG